jgi:hypothetical protein
MAKTIDQVFKDSFVFNRPKVEGSMLDELRRFSSNETMRGISNKYVHLIKNNLPRAKQFIFDEKSSEIMANFIQEAPELLFKNEQFAIPHFDVSYYEFDADLFLQAFGRPKTDNDEGKDWRVGYLVIGDKIFIITKSFQGKYATPSVLMYMIKIGPFNGEPNEMIMSRRMKAAYMLGSSDNDIPMEMRNVIVEKYHYANLTELPNERVIQGLPDGAGDLRNLITMILFLYQSKKVIDLRDVAPKRGFMKGKQVTYMAQSVVTIHLNEVKAIRKYMEIAHERASPRRHWCKPFYRTIGGSHSCDHTFEEYKEERWKCTKCEAKRARVKSYQKGDATKGYVLKHYEVTE